MNCDSFIKARIEKNCAEPITQGVERTAWIGNRAQLDIANLEFVEGSTNQVLNLPLIKGAQLYPIIQYGTKPFEGLKTDLDGSGKLGGTASTEFPFIVPDNSPAVCENIIDPLLDGEFFVIWQNRHKNLRATNEAERGASAYQIAGLFNGLTLSARVVREIQRRHPIGLGYYAQRGESAPFGDVPQRGFARSHRGTHQNDAHPLGDGVMHYDRRRGKNPAFGT